MTIYDVILQGSPVGHLTINEDIGYCRYFPLYKSKRINRQVQKEIRPYRKSIMQQEGKWPNQFKFGKLTLVSVTGGSDDGQYLEPSHLSGGKLERGGGSNAP